MVRRNPPIQKEFLLTGLFRFLRRHLASFIPSHGAVFDRAGGVE
jgi:hypothetical protein